MEFFETFSSIFMVLCSTLGIICAVIFILVMAVRRRCRTMPTYLGLNTIIAGFIANTTCLCQSFYQIVDDGNDTLCAFRGFLLHAACGMLFHTLIIQALYRLFVTVYSTKQYLQSTRFIIMIVIFQWLFSIFFAFPTFMLGGIVYYAGSRICQVSMDDTLSWIYFGSVIYLIPLPILVFIYLRIVKYMKTSPEIIGNRSKLVMRNRQQREQRFLRRLAILFLTLYSVGFPYLIFFCLYKFHVIQLPPYAQRVSYIFITFGQGVSMLINMVTTEDVKKSMIDILNSIFRGNQVQNVNTINLPTHNRTIRDNHIH